MNQYQPNDKDLYAKKMYAVAWWSSLGAIVAAIMAIAAFVVSLATYMADR